MIRTIFKLLILVFILESSWASAAQYCRHELGLNVRHFGHHTHQHKTGDQNTFDQTSVKADDSSKTKIDNDCPYCHLGAMKSMLPLAVIASSANAPPPIVEILQSYPQVIPRQPERPNWLIAA